MRIEILIRVLVVRIRIDVLAVLAHPARSYGNQIEVFPTTLQKISWILAIGLRDVLGKNGHRQIIPGVIEALRCWTTFFSIGVVNDLIRIYTPEQPRIIRDAERVVLWPCHFCSSVTSRSLKSARSCSRRAVIRPSQAGRLSSLSSNTAYPQAC